MNIKTATHRLIALTTALLCVPVIIGACTAHKDTDEQEPTVTITATPEELQKQADMQKLTDILTSHNPFSNAKEEAAALTQHILAHKEDFLDDLYIVLENDRAAATDGTYETASLLLKADKTTSLPDGYVPPNLIALTHETAQDGYYVINRNDLSLRVPVERALALMAYEASRQGITLVVSSTYRSAEYQKIVYERYVSQMGQAAADRESARPGTSQHQLGTAVDFGSITDAFADTSAGIWILENGGRFGWSLSFPPGYEEVTGYRWESWHWRYIGVPAVQFQQLWFNDIQHYMLEFVYAWQHYTAL